MNVVEKIKSSFFRKMMNIKFLPTYIMLLLIFIFWIWIYNESVCVLAALFVLILSIIYISVVVILLLFRRFKLSLYFIVPVLLATMLGTLPIDLVLPIDTWPIRNKMIHARHYVEYVIQRHVVHPEMKNMTDNSPYNEWGIKDSLAYDYKIIFDPTDQVIYKTNRNDYSCPISFYKLDKHFYMQAHICP